MRVGVARLGLWLSCALAGSAASAQEPPTPAPEEGGGGEEQQEQQQEQQREQVVPPEGSEQTGGTEQGPPPAPSAGPPAAAPETPAAPSAPPHPAVEWPLSVEAIAAHLRGIAEAHPEVATLVSLGPSAAGREILALRLGARTEAADDARPVLLLLDYMGRRSAGPEAMLALAWHLAEAFEGDERVRALLSQTQLVLAPALDPDARAGEAEGLAPGASAVEVADAPGERRAPTRAPARSGVRFESNFPTGWQPETLRPGSGRVSLSEPECKLAAQTITSLRGCAVVLGFAPPAPLGQPYPGAELPAADREVFEKLRAALELPGARPLVPWFELGSPGGGLFDFAYQARGMYPLVFQVPTEEELAAGILPSFAAEVRTRVLRCLALLPRVEIVSEGLERVIGDTWQLDVRIQNVGILPTSSALGRQRELLADVGLVLTGAKLVATAKKPESGGDYVEASLFKERAPLSMGTLSGGESRWLRLLFDASPGSEVRLTASSPWAGKATVQVTLP